MKQLSPVYTQFSVSLLVVVFFQLYGDAAGASTSHQQTQGVTHRKRHGAHPHPHPFSQQDEGKQKQPCDENDKGCAQGSSKSSNPPFPRPRDPSSSSACSWTCPYTGEPPVCGSDGILYDTRCGLKKEGCLLKLRRATIDGDESEDNSSPSHTNLEVDESGRKCVHFLDTLRSSDNNNNNSGIGGGIGSGPSSNSIKNIITGIPKVTEVCTKKEFENFIRKLLSNKKWRSDVIAAPTPMSSRWKRVLADGPEADKDHLIQLIFSSLDHNSDFILNYAELYEGDVELKESQPCQWRDFLQFQDADSDGKLHLTEFFAAFQHLYGVTMISLEKALEWKGMWVRKGDDVHMFCDVLGSPPTRIIWKTNNNQSLQGGPHRDPHVIQEMDGSLRILSVGFKHEGNYSCRSDRNEEVVQIVELVVKEKRKGDE